MMSWRTWIAGLLTAVVAGCGGGGGSAGSPIMGTTPAPTPSDLTLVLSSTTIKNSGSDTVEATVTAVDANRNALEGVQVTISVDSGATVVVAGEIGGKTGPDGKVVGSIGIGSDKTQRKIIVTASSGSIKKTAELTVVDAGSPIPTAADMVLTLSALSLPNSGTQTITATLTAVDANRNAVPNIPVIFAVDNGATAKVNGTVTDADGKITAAVGIGDDKTNRLITVTATSGALFKKEQFQIIGSQIKTTLLPSALNPGQIGKIQYKLADVNGNPVPNKSIVITGANGTQTTGVSDVNGDFEYTYTAPANPGEIVIRAAALGVQAQSNVLVLAGQGEIPPVTIKIQSASVSANPSVVPVNLGGSTSNQASIRALFLSEQNAPVKNIRVRFDLGGDPQSIGGTFTAGTTMLYSDGNGVATTSYIPGSRFSPTDGVTIRACWDYGDFALGSCPNSTFTTLTVAADALSVSIGTNNLIADDSTGVKYVNRYVVQVVDSSGNAVADVEVRASLDLLTFWKGVWVPGLERWEQVVTATCDNEDLNRNGVAEEYTNGWKEDVNDSANLTTGRPALEPRKADVALSFEGSTKTSTSGSVVLRIEYPQNLGSWDVFNLVVSASGVAGTEGRANFVGVLPVPATAVNRLDLTPPFRISPYGVEESPKVSPPEGSYTTRTAPVLCTNPN